MAEAKKTNIGESDILDLLESLVDKSLASYDEPAPGEGRYRLSETLRDYARELPDTMNETAWLRGRHRDYFTQLAEQSEPQLTGPDQALWFDRLDAEHDNLRAALSWSHHDEPERGLRIAAAIWRFWFIRGHQSEGRRNLLEALTQSDTRAGQSLRAMALNGAGNLSWSLTDYTAANSLLNESLTIRQELGDGWGVASSFNNLGNVAFAQGDYDAAGPLYEESLSIRRDLDDRRGIALTTGNLGRLAEALGRFSEAKALYEESLALHRELEDLRGISISLGNLGNVAISLGHIDDARRLQEQSVAIRRELGNKWGIASSLHSLGEISKLEKIYAAARRFYSDSLLLRDDLGDRLGIAESFEAFANLFSALQSPMKAVMLWGAAARLRDETGTPMWPKDRERYSTDVETARAALRDESFTSHWEKGRSLTLQQAIAYALDDADE